MKWKLTESAKTKYGYTLIAIIYVGMLATFALQGMGVL